MTRKFYFILLILLIPNVSGFTPIFVDSSNHYYNEVINLGSDSDLPFNTVYFVISISSKDTKQVYFLNEFDIYDKDKIYFIPSNFFSSNLIINYEFYDESNILIENFKFNLNLESNKFISGFIFCKDIFCFESSNLFVFGEDIFLSNNNVNNNILYNIKIFNESKNLILELDDVYLPYKLNLDPGYYFLEVYFKYDDKKYLFSDLDLSVISNPIISNPWQSYFSSNETIDLNLYKIDNNIYKMNDNNYKSFKNKIIYFLFLILFLFIIYLIFNKKKKNINLNNSNINRREKRHARK